MKKPQPRIVSRATLQERGRATQGCDVARPPLDLTKVEEIGLLIGDAREGPFVLVVDWVKVK